MGRSAQLPIDESIARIGAVTREDLLSVARRVTVEVTYFLEGTLAGEEVGDDGNEDEGI